MGSARSRCLREKGGVEPDERWRASAECPDPSILSLATRVLMESAYQRSTDIAKKLIKALQCPCPIGENVAVSLPCFHRKQGRFEKGLRLRIESGHSVEEAFGSLRFQSESPRQLPKVLATMEPVLFETLRLELIGKQLQREGAFLRQVQPRVHEIVGWAEDMVPERRRHEGEVLEVRVAVAHRIIEDDDPEELLDFDRIGRAVTLQDPTDSASLRSTVITSGPSGRSSGSLSWATRPSVPGDFRVWRKS